MRKALGQYMTPKPVGDLLARKVTGYYDQIVDLAAGDCSLLSAFAAKFHRAKVLAVDIDSGLLSRGADKIPRASFVHADGLSVNLGNRLGRLLFAANPPYSACLGNSYSIECYEKIFGELNTSIGKQRLEVYFLARYLQLLKHHEGSLVIIMPAGFCDGERYRPHRARMMELFALKKCIEFPAGVFPNTEARTVALVIDSKRNKNQKTEVSLYDRKTHKEQMLYKGIIVPGERIDAKFYRSYKWNECLTLRDLGVTIVRGKYCNKVARSLSLNPIHTTNLSQSKSRYLTIPTCEENTRYIQQANDAIAEPGDILLSRTGKRVSWTPYIVTKGKAPITDHVFRIRVPEENIDVVMKSFEDPNFSEWIESVSKGVCASVLTKRDLLTMPVFANH